MSKTTSIQTKITLLTHWRVVEEISEYIESRPPESSQTISEYLANQIAPTNRELFKKFMEIPNKEMAIVAREISKKHELLCVISPEHDQMFDHLVNDSLNKTDKKKDRIYQSSNNKTSITRDTKTTQKRSISHCIPTITNNIKIRTKG